MKDDPQKSFEKKSGEELGAGPDVGSPLFVSPLRAPVVVAPAPLLASNGTDEDHELVHVRTLSKNKRVTEQYLHRWPGGFQMVTVADQREMDQALARTKVKLGRMKKHHKPSEADRRAKNPHEPIKWP